jgi:hypothetical protein
VVAVLGLPVGDVTMGAERPAPLDGYSSWIESYLGKYGGFGSEEARAHALKELEELKAKAATGTWVKGSCPKCGQGLLAEAKG